MTWKGLKASLIALALNVLTPLYPQTLAVILPNDHALAAPHHRRQCWPRVHGSSWGLSCWLLRPAGCCMRPVSSRSGREHLRSICKSYSRLAALDRHALLQRFSFASALLMGIWMCWMQSGASCAFANPASTWQRWLIWVFFINPLGSLYGYRRKRKNGVSMIDFGCLLIGFSEFFPQNLTLEINWKKVIFGWFGITQTRTRNSGYPNCRVLLLPINFGFQFSKPEKPDPNFSGNRNTHP